LRFPMERKSIIESVLFPVDFSASCVAMGPFVKRSAQMFSARVTLLHAVEPPASGFELMTRSPREIEEDREHVARERLHSFLASDFPVHGCTRLVCTGDPATRIAEIARDRHFDIIVMPTHAGTFRRTLLGSTTAKVLNDADCPVLTTQHAETISPRPLEHREWVCAVSLGADSERVLTFACQAAKAVHANLSLIHAIPAEPGVELQFDIEERVQSQERMLARERVEELKQKLCSHAPVNVVVGPVKDALIEAARRLKADALVIGRSAEVGVRLRDLTYAVVRDAPCPVLSV
jgi:nucleotide-binding universal stress UspA family protein